MSASTAARLERVLALVPWLLEHPGATLTEIAERFDADPEEVAADLDVLGYCGVPGYGGGDLVEVAVVDDEVTVRMADFFRRPLTLSTHEALTLLLAARSLAMLPALSPSPALERATAKLSDALGLSVEGLPVDLSAPGDELVGALSDAVERRRVVRLVYRSATDARDREREVEPWALVAGQGGWYLRGWCRLAREARDFRTDRMREATVTDEAASAPPPGPSPDPPAYQPGESDLRAVLDLEPSIWWVLDAVAVESVEPLPATAQRPELRRATVPARSVEWIARLVLELGGAARVVAPEPVIRRVAELADRALAAYPDAG